MPSADADGPGGPPVAGADAARLTAAVARSSGWFSLNLTGPGNGRRGF
ncbi:hypothetical protein SSCG_02501 [Streptomyces clavuligerus]|nr:hypothetical protein SSCG_02501 [Streptomyces clavuligerus]